MTVEQNGIRNVFAFALVSLLIIICVFSAPANASGDAEFTSKCQAKCTAQGREQAYCDKWCGCQLTEFKKEFGDDVFQREEGSDVGVDKIGKPAARCTGRYMDDYFAASYKMCDGVLGCKETVDCLVRKLKTKSEERAGTLIVAYAFGEAATQANLLDHPKFQVIKPDFAKVKSLHYACSGEVNVKLAETQCREGCGSDKACNESCPCLSQQMRAFGTDEEIGRLVEKVEAGDAAGTQEYEKLLKACDLEFQ